MKIWIPEKTDIENILNEAMMKLKRADLVSDVEEYLTDTLSELDSHVYNRAGIERGEIKP